MRLPGLMALLLVGALARANGAPSSDPIESRLFPPDLIMEHQSELRIDDKQREAIIADMQTTQSQLVPLQWQMKAASDELTKVLDAPRIDASKALAIADKIMSIESQFKRSHLGLLIRIRNLLTDEQRAKLVELRKAAP